MRSLTLLLLLALSPLLRAEESADWSFDNQHLGLLRQSTELFGDTVKDSNSKTLGKLRDLLVDLRSGQLVAVLVAPGKNQLVPVPARTFAYASKLKLALSIPKSLFAAAPRLVEGNYQITLSPELLAASFRHFSEVAPALAPDRVSQALSVAHLIGMPLRGRDHHLLGTVKDVMADLPGGKIVYLVIDPAAAPDAPARKLFVLPPVVLTPVNQASSLTLDVDSPVFLAGPNFSDQFWSDLAFPELAAAVRNYYHLQPGAVAVPAAPAPTASTPSPATTLAAADPSAPPPPAAGVQVQVRIDGQPGAVLATQSADDQQITRAILAEIVHDAKGFLTLNLSVTTANGRVTLSGLVKNDQQKRLLLNAAQRIVGPNNLDDRLATREKSKTAGL